MTESYAPSSPAVHRLRGKGSWLSLRHPSGWEYNTVSLPISKLPESLVGFRILHVTDLHLRMTWSKAHDELVAMVAERRPDIVLLTGDLVENVVDFRPTLATARRMIDGLACRLGVYMTLGNHDGDLLGPTMLDWGVHFINGRTARLRMGEAMLEIVGVPGVNRDDLFEGFIDTVPKREPKSVRIAMSHYPDAVNSVLKFAPDIILSGHTHGGQVCLPGGIPIITHDASPRKYAKGIHRVGDTWFVVSRGFGFAKQAVRVCCPAEVMEIELVRP